LDVNITHTQKPVAKPLQKQRNAVLIVKKEPPPMYETILAELKPQGTAFFCYGNTVYSPSGADVPEDILFHEQVHSERQGNNPMGWWSQYLIDPSFRLKEELLAYQAQLKFIKQHFPAKAVKEALEEMSHSLANSYNLNMNHHQASTLIRKGMV
jgi:hypothetical protein